MNWFTWPANHTREDSVRYVHSLTVKKMLAETSAPLDIGFYAKRPIRKGEELFLDYGTEWETAWLAAGCHINDNSKCDEIGSFRHYIGLKPGFIPNHWINTKTKTEL